MRELLQNRQIYSNHELQDFILQLETRYNVTDLSGKYSNAVNFSENQNVPFHKWFRYREGFSGNLVKELIRESGALKDDVIVDPFSGSGTTPVVAALGGYSGLGIDVNPLTVYIANVKMRQFTKKVLQTCKEMLNHLHTLRPQEVGRFSEIERYFTPSNFRQLNALRGFIDEIDDDDVKSIMLVSFLCIIEPCSNRRREGNGLKTVMTKVPDVIEAFKMKTVEIIGDLETTYNELRGEGKCIVDTATDLRRIYEEHIQPEGRRVGTIIFSPPYPNSFDYFESYKLELVFGGFTDSISGINKLRERAVRSFISGKPQKDANKYIELIAEEIETSIPKKEAETGKKDFRTRKVPNMLRGYFSDMQEVLEQCSLVLETGRKVYIVVDQSSYVGVIVPTDLLLAYLGEQVGFRVENITECRKSRTSAQQLNRFPYLKNTLRESIVEFEKK